MKIIVLIFTLFFLSACTKQPVPEIGPVPSVTDSTEITISPVKTMTNEEKLVALNTKDGQIVIKLYTKEAPNTVANFIKKIDSGFYDKLIFHRVEPGFVVQGGDPLGNGTGGGQIASEINAIVFKRGSLGLARGNNINISNDSQFFICLTDDACQHLTGQYVNFGEVVSGLELVDKIKIGDQIISMTTKTK